MEDAYKQFAAEFAAAVCAKDYQAAQGMLAPWLQQTIAPAKLQEMIEREIREVCEAAELEEPAYPEAWDIDGNSSTLESLRDPSSFISTRNSGWLHGEGQGYSGAGDIVKPIAADVTAENFRQWLCIQFMPNEDAQGDLDIDAFVDFWMALVEVNGQYKIGYFELEDPD
jgi:hypothetical protein